MRLTQKEASEQKNVSDGREPMDVPNIRFSIKRQKQQRFVALILQVTWLQEIIYF